MSSNHAEKSIKIADNHQGFSSANFTVLSSESSSWRNLTVKQLLLPAVETSASVVQNYEVVVHLGQPNKLEWLENGRFREGLMTPNTICITPRGSLDKRRVHQETEVLVVSLAPQFVERMALESFGINRVELLYRQGISDTQLQHTGLALLAEMQAGFPSGSMFGDALAAGLAARLLAGYSVFAPTIKENTGGLSPQQLRRAIEFINDNLAVDLPLEGIAHAVGLSVYHFARMFKATNGNTPHEYVIQQRIKAAERLLAETDLSLVAVAHQVGFKDQSHFTRLFRRHTGATPQVYRKLINSAPLVESPVS